MFRYKPQNIFKYCYIEPIPEKRYSNLCALCENPEKCDYPDKYSGYDGSIRCLAENGGDVAFTKVIFVKRHFGVRACIYKRTFDFNTIKSE